jgi:hypothetical protein
MKKLILLLLITLTYAANLTGVSIQNTPTINLQPSAQIGIKMIDTSGNAQAIHIHSGGYQHVIAEDHLSAIAGGLETGHTPVYFFGYNPDVDNVFEDIWYTGGTYVFPPTPGIQMVIKSSSASDNFVDSGVRSIHLHYLDYPTLDEKVVTYNLNGLAGVTTNETNIYRVQYMHSQSAGSSGVSIGDITITNTDGSINYARIQTGTNTTQKMIWTVPGNKTLYLTKWNTSSASTSTGHYARFYLRATESPYNVQYSGLFLARAHVQLQDGAQSEKFEPPLRFSSGTDIKISVIGDASNSNISASGHFEGWYE